MNEVHIPTLAGQSNVVTVEALSGKGERKYEAIISQSGTNAPTTVVIENTLGEVPVFSRSGNGQYSMTLVNPLFLVNKTFLYIQQGLFNGYASELQRVSDNVVNIYSGLASNLNLADGRLNGVSMLITVSDTTFTSQEEFDNVIASMDANQQSLWNKIVIRDSGTVTEVDGRTYRRTNDLVVSSKVIQS